MRGLGRWVLAWVGATLTTLFFSELLFWNEEPARAVLTGEAEGIVLLLVIYGVCTLGLSAALSRSGGRLDLPVWVLAGALFGWIVEGAAVPAVYENPPGSFLWTSLGWHVPVDILWGVFLLPLWLRNGSFGRILLACVGTGLFWGIWSTWVWDDQQISLATFTRFTVIASLFAVPGLILLASSAPALATMPRWAQRIVALLILCLFALTGAGVPMWAGLLIGVVAVVWSALPPAAVQPIMLAPLRFTALLPLLLIPICAVLSYTAMFALGWQVPLIWTVGGLTLGSTVLVLWAIWRGFTTR